MGLSGNLQTMLPGDLLQWLSLGQKTGTLVITNKRVEKKIFFRRGRVISWACEPDNCNDHEWTVFIDPAGTSVEICYRVGERMGRRSRWFRTGSPPELRPIEGCPA